MGVGCFSFLVPRCFRSQSSQFLSQQLVMPTSEENERQMTEEEPVELRKEKTLDTILYYGCKHFGRKYRIRAPCCNEIFDCHICHDEAKNTNEIDDSKRHVLLSHCVEKKLIESYISYCNGTAHCYYCEADLFRDDGKDLLNWASSSNPAPSSSEYYSLRIHSMIMKRMNKPNMNKVEFEVEASKVTWSETSPSVVVGDELAAENLKVFKSLQQEWPSGFFRDWQQEGQLRVGEKLAEGGQAELFVLHGYNVKRERVIKMFKEGLCLQALQRLLPHGMLEDGFTRKKGWFFGGAFCNAIEGALLMHGRFAIVMERKWGDLRKLIDVRMNHNNMHDPPFTEEDAAFCMLQIATGMRDLHSMNITHGDLKAANVLVKTTDLKIPHILDPFSCHFTCEVADYECSVGVVGTGFWRAPEILFGVKNRNITPDLFSQAADVYSYGMTCYEILTGRIPFEVEEFRANDYDRVIDGYRPNLPSQTPEWMKALLRRCWHKESSKRPTFEEIFGAIEWKYAKE